MSKRTKKVEFCKTEVHFAADCGKVNIVETDEKPPPTQNFRRRRRNSGIVDEPTAEDYNKLGLPVLHFGDTSYEKSLLGYNNENEEYMPPAEQSFATVTVNTNSYIPELEDDQKENNDSEVRKGILKNKPIKPRPYLLGKTI